ncbi:Ig-like domain-containing protein [Cognaticolwellia mytili]|uniref:Ig-like domain-containing protein n=1 Tax=Cognaticolwellia mytili TaxID=1888913 RepID=UPI000A171A92|nr:Ig-like domain-containing protein [Cognaticolwellia mytili]
MQNYINSKDAQVTMVKGAISTDSTVNKTLQVGDIVEAGARLVLSKNSEILLSFDDGSQQRVYNASNELDGAVSVEIIPANEPLVAFENIDINNIQNEISAIQDLIDSGEDIEGPETAAGLVANEGTSFVTLNRVADETIAQAGYDTTEQANATILVSDPESLLTNLPTPSLDLLDNDEAIATLEDTIIAGNVLTNASSSNGSSSVTDFTIGGITFAIGTTATLAEGDLTLNADGSYTFVPASNYNGAVPVVTYTVTDGAGDADTSTLTISVTPVSDLTDDNEIVSTNEDASISGNVLDNGESADNPLSLTGFTIGGVTYAIGATAALAEGDLTLNANGSYTFVPADNYNGAVPVVTYIVTDGAGDINTSTLTISVTPVSDLTDDNEIVSTNEDTSISGNVLSNGSSADNPLSVTDFTIGGITFAIGTTATLAEGNLTLNADGSYTFVPADNYNGAVPVVTYTVTDGAGDTDTSTLTISVTPVSDLTDDNEVVSTPEDTNISGNVLNNGASADNPLSVTDFTIGGITFAIGTTAALAEGDLTLNADGSYTFVPASNYNGAVPVVTYTVTDGAGDTDTSTLTISVTPVSTPIPTPNTAPVAEDDSFSVDEGTSVSGNVISHNDGDGAVDSDPEGDTLSITHINGVALSFDASVDSGYVTVNVEGGTLRINAQGDFTYTHTSSNTTPANFNYTINDGASSADATVTIGVTPTPNTAPVAEDDSFSVDEGTSVSGNVISHNDGDGAVDSDPEGDTLSITHINGVALSFDASVDSGYVTVNVEGGTLRINAQGDFTYTHTSSNTTPANFNYTINDGASSADATVTIGVTPTPNTALIAEDDRFVITENNAVSGNVISHNDGDGAVDTGTFGNTLNITHVNGVALNFEAAIDSGYVTVNVEGGTLRINAQGDFTYTSLTGTLAPNDFPTFEYTISDSLSSDNATVTIDFSPDAFDDRNFVAFKTNEVNGITESTKSRVKGNVIDRESSGDQSDSSPDGIISLMKIDFGGQTYEFQSGITELDIAYEVNGVEVGILHIESSGYYLFTLNAGVDANLIPASLEFVYTIQDGDTINPETDQATLTIGFYNVGPASTPGTLIDDGGLIDLSFNDENIDIVIGNEEGNSIISPDLSDLFANEHADVIDDYITTDEHQDKENTIANDELPLADIEQAEAKLDSEATVVNGFLAEGATLQSDASVENVPQLTELDSTDIL